MSEFTASPEIEISDDEKRALIDKIRALAPLEDKKPDDFGTYRTNFMQPDGYTTIYIPGLSGLEDVDIQNTDEDDIPMVDERVEVIERVEDVLDNGLTTVHNRQWVINEKTLEAYYRESDKVFNSDDGTPLTTPGTVDIADIVEIVDLEEKLRPSPLFNALRQHELLRLLDSLDLNDTF
jgi:hypothetical protein